MLQLKEKKTKLKLHCEIFRTNSLFAKKNKKKLTRKLNEKKDVAQKWAFLWIEIISE